MNYDANPSSAGSPQRPISTPKSPPSLPFHEVIVRRCRSPIQSLTDIMRSAKFWPTFLLLSNIDSHGY